MEGRNGGYMNDLRRAQARYDSREQPGGTPYHPDAVDEAIQYVRLAQRAGASETPFELLVEATPPYRAALRTHLVVRAEAAWQLGLGRLATTTAIQRHPLHGRAGDVLWALDTLAATLSAGWRSIVGHAMAESRRAEVLALLGGGR